MRPLAISRRRFLAASAAGALALVKRPVNAAERRPAQIAITLDLEMSRHYPRRGMTEWDYQKGNLDEATKQYAVEAAKLVENRGGKIHFFCVGRVLEQPNVDWLKSLAQSGHLIGNHTYDHVNVLAQKSDEIQFRFQRAPWLLRGKQPTEVIHENILLTNIALRKRIGIAPAGFRTPGGFSDGLAQRQDVQHMLLDLGFRWVSSKYPRHPAGSPMQEPGPDVYAAIVESQKQAQPFVYPTGLIEIPMNPISDVNAFRSHFWKLSWYLKAVEMAVKWAIETGGMFDFLAHPSCLVVEDPKFEAIKLICDLVNNAGDRAAIVDLDTIAERLRPPKDSQ